jgi:tetratricopeptide (TPR) repeat protein
MKKRVPWLVLAAASAVGCAGGDATGMSRGAPVVVISVDTLRADHLPAYGYTNVATPHVDAFRRDAILFENAYTHCPLTLPAHLSLLTGLLPAEHAVRNNLGYRFDGAAHPTLARLLKAQGYATGAAVSAYVLRGATGLSDSFDFFDDAVGEPREGVEAVSVLQRPGSETVRRALAWVEGVKGKPFFLFVHLYEPHVPYDPPEPFRGRFGATYEGEIAAADAAVGDLLDGLRRARLYDRALVLFVSDHGEGLGDHGEQEHGILLYREALHVPLLLKLPGGRERGSSVAKPVGLVDVVPTVAAVLGLTPASGLRGTSLLERKAAGPVYSETYYPRIHLGWSELRSLVGDRYHYIEGPRPELYDLGRDPVEKSDTAAADAASTRTLAGALARYPSTFAEPGAVDPDAAEKLRSLGYLAGGAAPASTARPNPRDQLPVYEEMRAAFGLARQGKDVEAAAALRRVLAKSPGSFDAQWELAAVLTRLRRYEEAAAAYEAAMAASPSLAGSVAISLGELYLETGKADKAAAAAERALADEPRRAHRLLARVALARGDLAEAERRIGLTSAGGPLEPETALVIADLHVRRSEPDKALAVLEAARTSSAASQRAVAGLEYRRGDVLARLGRNAEAEAAFREAIRTFPKRPEAYASLAVVLTAEGRPRAEVRSLLEAMVEASPGADTAALAAKTLDFVRDPEGAARWRRKAAASGSDRRG